MEELDLKRVFSVFWIRKAQIVLIILMFILAGIFYSLFIATPKYKASTTLVLAKTEDGNTDISITQTEVALNQKLVLTYSELIKSKAVLRQVLDNLKILDISEDYIRNNVTVNSVKNTELIEISVTNENKYYVDIIANEIANVFAEKVAEMYNINNVHVVDKAEEPTVPYNINHVITAAIFAAIGMACSIVYAIVAGMLDNTVKNAEDIEKETELTVLATIPKYDFENSSKGGTE